MAEKDERIGRAGKRKVMSQFKSILQSIYRRIASVLSGRGLGKLFLFQAVNIFFLRSLKTTMAKVQGQMMYIDPQDSLQLSVKGIYEPFETSLVDRLLAPGDVAVDIGAHIGYYTLLYARRVGSRGHVYAFEPSRENFLLLRKNITLNHYEKRVTALQKAVSAATGTGRLYTSTVNAGDHHMYPSSENRVFEYVQTLRLDNFFAGQPVSISLLKMDIQGSEGGAITGMQGLMRQGRIKKILMEFWPIGMKEYGMEAAEVLELIQSLGYRLHMLVETERVIVPIHAQQLLARYTPEKRNHTNILCLKDNVLIR